MFTDSKELKTLKDEVLLEFRNSNAWNFERALVLHKCIETGAIIYPLQKAYYGSVFLQKHGIPLFYYNWLSEAGYIMWKLKGWL